ncbi:MAG: hypothetical protein ACXVJB_14760 [Mucilaginibacter sp.]
MRLRIIAATKIMITCQIVIGCVLFGLMVPPKVPPTAGTLSSTYMLMD